MRFQGPVQFSNGDRLGVIEIQQFQGKHPAVSVWKQVIDPKFLFMAWI